MSKKKKHHVARLKRQVNNSPNKSKFKREFDRQSQDRAISQTHRVSRSVRKKVTSTGEGCYICHWTEGLTVHHVMPKRLGGSNQIDNLVCLCDGCHALWHSVEAQKEWQWFEFYEWVEQFLEGRV